MKTIFEQIINGEIPSYKIYENNKYIGILDIYPDAKGHSLLIPKKKKTDILHEDETTRSELINIGSKIAKNIKAKLNASGIRLTFNTGKTSGQVIFHTHLHIIPSYEEKQTDENLKEVLKKIMD